MKNLLLYFLSGFPFIGFAQVHSAMPPEANTFYNYAMPTINPEIKNLIIKKANHIKGQNISLDSLIFSLKKEPELKKMSQQDMEAIAVLIMIQASKNTDNDLKNLVMNMRRNNDKSAADSNKTETLLEQKSKIARNISMVMKKISDSQERAITNLK